MFSFTRDELKNDAEGLKQKREDAKRAKEAAAERERIKLEEESAACAERVAVVLKFSEKAIKRKLAGLLVEGSRPIIFKWNFSVGEKGFFRNALYRTLAKELQSKGFSSVFVGLIPDELTVYADEQHRLSKYPLYPLQTILPMPPEGSSPADWPGDLKDAPKTKKRKSK